MHWQLEISFGPLAKYLETCCQRLANGSFSTIAHIISVFLMDSSSVINMHIVLFGSLTLHSHRGEIYCLTFDQELNSCLTIFSLQSHVPLFLLPPLLMSE